MGPAFNATLLVASSVALLAQTVGASPASYVPDNQWDKKAWQCKEAGQSFIEVEHVRIPTETVSDLRVTELQIDTKKIDANSVSGLNGFLAKIGGIQAISGTCGRTGEFIFIRGFVREGPDLRATREQRFFIPYSR